MIIVCLYTMRRHSVALLRKAYEYEDLVNFITQIVEGQGFRTRRIRMDISGEQTSTKMVDFLTSKGIRSELVPRASPTERQLQTLF